MHTIKRGVIVIIVVVGSGDGSVGGGGGNDYNDVCGAYTMAVGEVSFLKTIFVIAFLLLYYFYLQDIIIMENE